MRPSVRAYGPGPDQFLELTLPDRPGPHPVAVVAGTCKGCQRNIPPQMANDLRTGN